MQKDHTKKEELHSRREFIQKATKGILPILGAMFIPDIVLKIKAETFLQKSLAIQNKSSTFAPREPAKPLHNA